MCINVKNTSVENTSILMSGFGIRRVSAHVRNTLYCIIHDEYSKSDRILTLDEALDNLELWVQSLARVTESTIPHIRHTMSTIEPVPEGAPSYASAAEMELQQIRKKLDEVNAAVEYVYDAIFLY